MQAPEIATVEDLVRILDEHPQWLEALRERLLTRELLALPQQLADFAAATERRFEAVERQLQTQGAQLQAQGAQLQAQRGQLEAQGAQLEAQGRRLGKVEDRLDGVEGRLGKVEGRLDGVEGQLNQLRIDIGPLKAAHVRNAARSVADAIAEEQGVELVAILDRKELGAMLRSSDTHGISKDDLESFRLADMVLRATGPDGAECYVAVEVSFTANGRDTRRAVRNAEYLTRFTGRRAYAVVAGQRFDDRIRAAVKSGAVAWYELHQRLLEVD